MKEEILIGVGGNLPSHIGPPRETIKRALQLMMQQGLQIEAVSGVYQTAPVPASDQPDFTNIAVKAVTELRPGQLLGLFQHIEIGCGRKPAERWSARTLDIDLLAFGLSVLPSPSLWRQVVDDINPSAILPEPVVPHPRLHKRTFVLVPLLDIAPNWRHPVLDHDVRELAAAEHIVGESALVQRISASL